jgi:hypothetical protein
MSSRTLATASLGRENGSRMRTVLLPSRLEPRVFRRALASVMLAAATVYVLPTRAEASTLVLDCTPTDQVQAFGTHNLIEVDFDSARVRVHTVTADGAPARLHGKPFADYTEPAEISESVVRWRHRVGNTSSGEACFVQQEVGRYSGVWEVQVGCASAAPIRTACEPSKVGKGKRLF